MKPRYQLLLLLILVTQTVMAQSNAIDSTFRAIEGLFEAGSYVGAELEARRVIEAPGLVDSTRVLAEKWIAFSLIAQGKSMLANDHFTFILKINPQFELDPVLTSPKILAVFNEAKSSQAIVMKPRDTRELPYGQEASTVSFRTIIFPGWEQLHTNRSTAGYLFLAGGIGALGAGLTFEILRSSARNEYLSATTQATIESKYSRYNKYYNAEIAAFSMFAIVYVASEIDVFTNAASLSITQNSPPVSGSSLSLRIRF